MNIISIDPGTTESAWMEFNTTTFRVVEFEHVENEVLLDKLIHRPSNIQRVICEGIQSYGMAVGKSTFTTCIWIGRYMQAVGEGSFEIVYRGDIKLHLCHSSRAKDKNVAQALKDKFPATGGGKDPVKGIKKQPGPLFGVGSHIWSALAVAVYYTERESLTANRFEV